MLLLLLMLMLLSLLRCLLLFSIISLIPLFSWILTSAAASIKFSNSAYRTMAAYRYNGVLVLKQWNLLMLQNSIRSTDVMWLGLCKNDDSAELWALLAFMLDNFRFLGRNIAFLRTCDRL